MIQLGDKESNGEQESAQAWQARSASQPRDQKA